MDIGYVPSLRRLVFYCYSHGDRFRLRGPGRRFRTSGLSRSGMRQNEHAREPLNRPARLSDRCRSSSCRRRSRPRHQGSMPILGLFQISGRAFDAPLNVFRETADQLIFAIQKLRQRQLDVLGNALDFCGALAPRTSLKKAVSACLIQPTARGSG